MARSSFTTSTTQSQSDRRSRWSRKLPGRIFFRNDGCMARAGLDFARAARAPSASLSGAASSMTMSSSSTWQPAEATWAAMPEPITPDPSMPIFLMFISNLQVDVVWLDQSFSMMDAMPWPPPMHMVAMPYLPPSVSRRFNRVVRMRAPLAPRGWPMAMAPPQAFTLAGS